MDRRRGGPMRPSSEEIECWTRSANTLRLISKHWANHPPLDLVGKANRLIATWPVDDVLPGEGWKSLRENYRRLTNCMEDIQSNADTEVKLIEESIEQIGILMALRRAPEAHHSTEKRNKRPRAASPGTPATTPQGSSRGASITLPPRTNSVGPSAQVKKLSGRIPLQCGRKVALYQSAVNPKSEADWILAIVIRVYKEEKGKYIYEVRDAEEQEGTQAPSIKAPQKYVIPLPDPKGPVQQEFPVGSTVLGLYPDTSCFYRAEVMSTPKQMQALAGAKQPMYKLKFEDDDNQEHPVAAEWVVEYPAKL